MRQNLHYVSYNNQLYEWTTCIRTHQSVRQRISFITGFHRTSIVEQSRQQDEGDHERAGSGILADLFVLPAFEFVVDILAQLVGHRFALGRDGVDRTFHSFNLCFSHVHGFVVHLAVGWHVRIWWLHLHRIITCFQTKVAS